MIRQLFHRGGYRPRGEVNSVALCTLLMGASPGRRLVIIKHVVYVQRKINGGKQA